MNEEALGKQKLPRKLRGIVINTVQTNIRKCPDLRELIPRITEKTGSEFLIPAGLIYQAARSHYLGLLGHYIKRTWPEGNDYY